MLFSLFVSMCFALSDDAIFFQRIVLGQTELNRDIVVEQFGDGAEVVAIISTIHGNEAIGTPLLLQFVKQGGFQNIGDRTILILSVANPDGYVLQRRGNSNNIDINRNFPTRNFGRGVFNGEDPLTAIETSVLVHFLEEYLPDRTLIIHQPLNGIDYDGSSKELALFLSEASNIRIKRLGSRSGSMGTFLGLHLEKQVITLEIPSRASQEPIEQVCHQYCVLLKEFVSYAPQ